MTRATGANQTYNVGVNFANRGEGSEVDYPTLGVCYAAACASALTIAYVGAKAVPKTGVLATLVPFTAVSLAGVVNVLLTRSNELVDGLEITDAAGERLGMSQAAVRTHSTHPIRGCPYVFQSVTPREELLNARRALERPLTNNPQYPKAAGVIAICLTGYSAC